MKIRDLLSKGYFTEELPPPFVTESFGKNHDKINKIISKFNKLDKSSIPNSDYVKYSIPKVGLHRRLNGIPNPYHQFILSSSIVKNWTDITNKYKSSKLSASIPEIDANNERAIIQFSKFNEFKENCLMVSFDTFYELKTDISKYYPSIYTHSIPWTIHTKAFAKANQGNSHYGNLLDECIRNTQNGQTNGIVIGTDTSRILAEIIGCYIDDELIKALKKEKIQVKGFRFVDDCHFFFYTRSDAEKALKYLQRILNDLNLNINEEKTCINKAPFQFESIWQQEITSLSIRQFPKAQRTDLKHFYNKLISLSRKYPKDSVLKYGIKIYKRIKIDRSNWELYESLTYSLALAEGAILPDVLQILLQNKDFVNKNKLESAIYSLLNQNIYKGHNYEVAWTLWVAKTFEISIERNIAQQIIDSSDVISTIILLDLRAQKLIKGNLKLVNLRVDFTSSELLSNKWLLIYEATIKKWIKSNCLIKNKFFDEISKLSISFYDNSKQIKIGEPNIKVQEKTNLNSSKNKEKDKLKSNSQKLSSYAKVTSYVG